MSNQNELLLRQWNMLRMIPRFPRKVTAREIMDKLKIEGFNVTKRTIERDLQSISTVFPLVSDERDKPYGWSWSKDAPSFDLPRLSQSEALVLKLSQQYLNKLMPNSMLSQLTPYFDAAEKSLNETSHPSPLAKWHEKIAVAFPGQVLQTPNINRDVLSIIETGLLEEKRIKIDYASKGVKAESHFTVHPLGIVIRGHISYLVCTVFDYQDIRMLAIHRITKVEILDDASNRPENFSINEYASSSVLGFNDNGLIDLVLKFNEDAGIHLYETPINHNQIIEKTNDGYLIVKVTTADNAQLKWWILGFGDQVEVIEPANLRQAISAIGQSMSRIYDTH